MGGGGDSVCGWHPEGACYAYARYVRVLFLCSVIIIQKSRQNVCHNKIMFVATNACLSRQK